MVFLLKMASFYGYVSHNQMVYIYIYAYTYVDHLGSLWIPIDAAFIPVFPEPRSSRASLPLLARWWETDSHSTRPAQVALCHRLHLMGMGDWAPFGCWAVGYPWNFPRPRYGQISHCLFLAKSVFTSKCFLSAAFLGLLRSVLHFIPALCA